jgi:hypothetical protein
MMILIGILFILPMIGAQMGLDFSIVSHVAAAVPVRSLRSGRSPKGYLSGVRPGFIRAADTARLRIDKVLVRCGKG